MVRGALAAITACLIAGAASSEDWRTVVTTEEVAKPFTFRWAAATGSIVGYEACIDYGLQGRYCTGVVETEFTVTPFEWYTWNIQVRATDGTIFGDWSEPSIYFSLNPNPADIDFDGGVGMSDFGILMQEWGYAAEPIE